MRASGLLNTYGEAFLRLFFPAYCGVCSAFLELEEKGICHRCFDELSQLKRSPEDAVIRGGFDGLDEGWALYPYESPVKEMIAAIKFQKKRWLIKVFTSEAKPLALAVATENHFDCLIPVPIDRKKLVEREFNQAELLARLIASWTGIPVRKDILRKRYPTPSQSQLGREERLTNLYGAFEVTKPQKPPHKSILLVDDILTTGATAEEAARCLKESGTKHVGLFALACTDGNR